jgi:hypothetical protein
MSAAPQTRSKLSSDIVFKLTNEEGAAVFDNVPINNYLICVEESKNYMGNEKGLNLISERTIQPEFSVFIELKPQISSFVEISFKDEEGRKIENAEVTALLLAVTEPIETDSED